MNLPLLYDKEVNDYPQEGTETLWYSLLLHSA